MSLQNVVDAIKERKLLSAIVVAVAAGVAFYLGAFDLVAEKVQNLGGDEVVEVVEEPEADAGLEEDAGEPDEPEADAGGPEEASLPPGAIELGGDPPRSKRPVP